ncbi:MAG: DNA polymerase III subunit alpha [Hydrogenothermaceae bacterium]|nr:DNA polymerase III subunit alpha [Hydrogenothermaceae bacterium]
MSKDFVHLHLHSHYSLLDGAIKIKELAKKARDYGYKAVALTDHGNIFGSIEFYQEMKKVGVKPIVGMEAYFTNNRFEKKGEGSDDILTDKNYHLILHAKNKIGFKNLMKLSSIAYTEGFYYKPRIDWELLEKYSEGLICQTACLKGFVPYLIASGKLEEAKEYAKRLKNIFGDDLYLEIQNNGLEEQDLANRGIIQIGKDLGIKVVATNDSHYLNEDDATAHDIIKALQMKSTLKDLKEKGKAFKVRGLHFTRPEEMYQKFKGYEEYLLNTMEVAEKCELEIDTVETRGYLFPKFEIPPKFCDMSPSDYFEKLSKDGLDRILERKKNLSLERRREYVERLEYEINVIKSMGFSEYFLIVQDFINYAKKNGVPVGPGRGSAAGSLVAYALGITEVDPLKHGLIFERFLNPDRISMPDIDVDFCMDNRDKVIDYVRQKYGKDSVAQIITFNFMKSKMVIRDVARVLGFSYQEADRIAKMILPGPIQGSTLTIEENLQAHPDFKHLYDTNPQVRELLDLSRKLEGSARHTGIHAAGIVIAPGPLDDYVPVYTDKDGQFVTQFEMKTIEQLGLVKMDFLGLKTLTELNQMKKLIKERHGIDLNYNALGLDNENVFNLLQSGKTTGVFQLESKGMQDLLARLKPNHFDEIIAILALFRPGPLMSGMVDEYIERKHSRKEIVYPFMEIKDILAETYGLIVYQEQIMFIANILSGFTMAEADTLRKAIGKKNPETMAKMRDRFIEGAVERGFDREKITKLWEDIEKFASYSFNKSHSTAYAYLSYWTAWVKTYYPEEFFTVKLSTESNDTKFLNILNDMENFDIRLLPPDINRSGSEFWIEDKKTIRFGLSKIKGVGEQSAVKIVEEREKNGRYTDIFNLCERLDSKSLNKKVLEALIKAGAFDFEGVDRGILLDNVDKAISNGQKMREGKLSGQNSLFGIVSQSAPVKHTYEGSKKLTEREKLKMEKEVLGFYLSGHPLSVYKKELRGKVKKISQLYDEAFSTKKIQSGFKTTIAGVVDSLKYKKTKAGNTMMVFSLSDETGQIDMRAFPDKLENKSIIADDSIVVVEGTVEIDEEQEILTMTVSKVSEIDKFLEDMRGLRIKLSKEKAMNGIVDSLKEIFIQHRGDKEVILCVYENGNFYCEIMLHTDFHVRYDDEFKHRLFKVVGERDVEIYY